MTEQTETRLRAALHAEVDGVDVDGHAWSTIQRRVRERRSRTTRRLALVAASIAVVVVGIGAVLALDDGDTTVDVRPADEATTTSTVTTESTTTSVVDAEPEPFAGIWPFATQEQMVAYAKDPGVGMFFDPDQTALEFAREYLGMRDPVVIAAFAPTSDASGTVVIAARPASPMTTSVSLRRDADDGLTPYTVTAADAASIEVDRAALVAPVGPPAVPVSGTSTAFEAHVDVEVRDQEGRVLGITFVMGGANGEMAAFSGEVPIEAPATAGGVVVLSTSSAADGSLQEATVVQVRFRP